MKPSNIARVLLMLMALSLRPFPAPAIATTSPSAEPPPQTQYEPPQTLDIEALKAKHNTQLPAKLLLIDEGAGPRTLGELLNRPTLLMLSQFSEPKDGGNGFLQHFSQTLHEVDPTPGAGYQVVVVSVRPDDFPVDAREARQALIAHFSPEMDGAAWRFCTAEADAIHALATAIGITLPNKQSQKDLPAEVITVVDSALQIIRYLTRGELEPRKIRQALTDAGLKTSGDILPDWIDVDLTPLDSWGAWIPTAGVILLAGLAVTGWWRWRRHRR